jgi:predicted GNAT family N-acyltransferase
MDLIVRPASGAEELAAVLELRRQVFVLEQGVDAALEHDAYDDACDHLIALLEDRPIATARYRRTERGVKLERVAVLAEYRGRGVGRALVRCAIGALPEGSQLYIHAQQSALGFWQRMDFVAEGPEFLEADIPHRFMRFDR